MDPRAGFFLITTAALGLGCTRPSSELELPTETTLAVAPAPSGDPDGDGVDAADDLCPEEYGLPGTGCPLRDSDQDGILDPDDACVDTPECVNGFDDEDGCPDGVPGELAAIFGAIEGLEFAPNKWEIRPQSYARLDQIAEVMLAYPGPSFEIAGHMDSKQHELASRRRPTQKRADSVRDYLIHQGVDPQRLESVGYGEEVPIASNKTAEGRALNRRVEIMARFPEWVGGSDCVTPDHRR